MNQLKKLFTWTTPIASKPAGEYNSKREGLAFLIGMLGQNIIYNIVAAALSIYYTDVVMIDITIVGVIFTVCRVWDALNDPIMGIIMERTNTRWGKCRPYLKVMPFPVAVITLLLFLPISTWPMGARIAYLFLIYFMWSPIYTLCDIPLWSLPSRMVPDEGKRTKLITAARIVGNIGAVVTAIYAPMKNFFASLDWGIFPNTGLVNYDGYFSQEQGYLFTTLILVVLGMILFKVTFPFVRERVKSNKDDEKLTIKEAKKSLMLNKPFIRIMVSSVLGCTKTLLLTAGMYFCKWVMGNGNEGLWLIYLGAPFLIGYILSMFLTPSLGKKFTKKKLYIWTTYISAIPMIIMFFAGFKALENLHEPGYLAMMIIMLGLYGFFSGFTAALQPIMIADSIDYIEWKSGKRNDGIFFSGLTFNSKLSAGIAILISNVMLGFVSYTTVINDLSVKMQEAANSGLVLELNFAAQYSDITMMMLVLITIVPAVGCILSAIPMHKYEITDKLLEEIRAANQKSHQEYADSIAKKLDGQNEESNDNIEKIEVQETNLTEETVEKDTVDNKENKN